MVARRVIVSAVGETPVTVREFSAASPPPLSLDQDAAWPDEELPDGEC
eukprot:COSAG03_NODE_3349_length_2065_cov_4.387080_5_plen_48_part_00